MIASLRATVLYGVSPVNRDFTSCNDRVDINSVRGSLVRPELIAARNRDRTYLINTGAQRSEDLEALRLEKKAADANGESFSCPACNNPINIYKKDRGFHRPTQQWLCAGCLKRAKVNDDIAVQIIDQKPKRSHDPDKSETQQARGVNWCAQDMWSQGKLEITMHFYSYKRYKLQHVGGWIVRVSINKPSCTHRSFHFSFSFTMTSWLGAFHINI